MPGSWPRTRRSSAGSTSLMFVMERSGSIKGPSHADTHPFARELGGRDYCFAHNGTLEGDAWELPLRSYRPVGATDSERFFCHLMGELAARGKPLDAEDDWAWLHSKLAETNTMGKLNVLFSDGHRLFIYHDVNGWKGLNFRKVRVVDGQPRHFGDAEMTVAIAGEASHYGFVIATCPMSSTGWHSFQRGELIVLDRGLISFSSHRDRRSAEFSPEPAASMI